MQRSNPPAFSYHAVRALFMGLTCSLLTTCGREEGRGVFSVEGKEIFHRGRPFYPMALNYGVSLFAGGNELWCAPSSEYRDHPSGQVATRGVDERDLRGDLELIHDMGFNTVRIVGFAESGQDSMRHCVRARTTHYQDSIVCLEDPAVQQAFLRSVSELLRMAGESGLKVILLTTIHPELQVTEDHFVAIARHVGPDTNLLAYDLFNEPLYFDQAVRTKDEVTEITEHWRRLMREHAPGQLCTIGLTGIRETFEWDPNMLDVDFISFHPYEYEPDQVRNELYWYGENVSRAWMLGETGLSADDDSVSYDEQRHFARKTMAQARACGAAGYSWWQFKDVDWNYFHSDFMGALERSGTTRSARSGIEVSGTMKPVVEDFRQFDPMATRGPCIRPPNYLNYSEGTVCKVTGRLVDTEGKPIHAGTVIAWNEYWGASHHTTTGPDGRFELRSPFWLFHWMVSGTRFSMDRGDCDPNGFVRGKDGIPAYEIGEVALDRLRADDRSSGTDHAEESGPPRAVSTGI